MTSGRQLIAFDDLDDRHCRWPIGDPKRGPFGFCGAEQHGAGPYCSAHRRQAVVQREPVAPPAPDNTSKRDTA